MKNSKLVSRRSALALPLALGGCGRVASLTELPPTARDAGAASDAQMPPPPLEPFDAQVGPQPSPRPQNQPQIQFDDAPPGAAALRGTVYSWTTAEQIAVLRQTGELLQRAERPGLGPGALFFALETVPVRPDYAGLIADLRSTAFAKGRYTWNNPWAAARGYQGEQYGGELLEIQLRPDALIMELVAAENGKGAVLRLLNLDASPCSEPIDAAVRARLAGVYFLNSRYSGYGTFRNQCPATPPDVMSGYREIYIGNPAMLARCSTHTQDLRDKLEQAAAKLELLAPVLGSGNWDASECEWIRRVRDTVWNNNGQLFEALDSYDRSLCFLDPPYRATTANLQALAQVLRDRLPNVDPFVKNY